MLLLIKKAIKYRDGRRLGEHIGGGVHTLPCVKDTDVHVTPAHAKLPGPQRVTVDGVQLQPA